MPYIPFVKYTMPLGHVIGLSWYVKIVFFFSLSQFVKSLINCEESDLINPNFLESSFNPLKLFQVINR